MINFKTTFRNLSNAELVNIVVTNPQDYTMEAIEVAKEILLSRGIAQPSNEVIEEAKTIELKKQEYIESNSDKFVKKLKIAIKTRNLYPLASFMFNSIIVFSLFSSLMSMLANKDKYNILGIIIYYILAILENIAILGIIPIVLFLLNRNIEKKQNHIFKIPASIFALYCFSLTILLFIIVIK